MTYTVVENALDTVLKIHADYSADNVSKGDFRILATGQDKAIILVPGRIPSRDVIALPRRVSTQWMIDVLVCIRFKDEISDIASRIRTERSTIIDHLDKYPTLDGTTGVVNAFITGGGDPEVWQGESSQWWVQRLAMSIDERTTITIAE